MDVVRRHSLVIGLLWLAWIMAALVPFLWENARAFRSPLAVAQAMGTGAWFWLIAAGLGWRCLRRLDAFDLSKRSLGMSLVRLLISCGVGMGLMATMALVVGSLVGVRVTVFLVALAAVIVAVGPGWMELVRQVVSVAQLLRSRVWSGGEIAAILLLMGLVGLQLPAALTPTLYPDTWRYHFGLTRIFEQMGRIQVAPDFAEANIASNWQMVYLPILLLSNDAAAQAFNWFTLPITAMVVALATRGTARLLAPLVLVSTPLLLGVAGLGNNDLGVTFFAALIWLVLRSGEPRSSVFWAGVFGGLAVGTKYPAILAVFAMLTGWGVLSRGRPVQGKVWRLLLAGLCVGYLPWFLRNAIGTGDPFYPVLSKWLPWGDAEARWVADHYGMEMGTYGANLAGWWRILLAPWSMTVADHRFFESDVGVIYWSAVPLTVWAFWRRPFIRDAMVACAVGVGLWSIGPQVARFLAPLLPVAAVAVAESWREWAGGRQQPRAWWVAGMGLLLINAWQTLTSVSGFSDPYGFLLQGMTREQYLAQHSPLYRIAQWAGQPATMKDKVLLLGEEGVWVFQNPVKISGPFNRKWIVEQAARSSSPAELAEHLGKAGIRFVCVNPPRMQGMDQRFGYLGWPSDAARIRFDQFLEKETQLVCSEGPIRLYELR